MHSFLFANATHVIRRRCAKDKKPLTGNYKGRGGARRRGAASRRARRQRRPATAPSATRRTGSRPRTMRYRFGQWWRRRWHARARTWLGRRAWSGSVERAAVEPGSWILVQGTLLSRPTYLPLTRDIPFIPLPSGGQHTRRDSRPIMFQALRSTVGHMRKRRLYALGHMPYLIMRQSKSLNNTAHC